MDWTDRHCRYFHRLLCKNALLYTEMVTAPAVVHGDRGWLLGFSEAEHPVALQLGGSDPEALAEATKIGCDFGYDEINLNVGCPSDRVQSGSFGACLMKQPDLVAECVSAMLDVAGNAVDITVKCRIGVDDQDPEQVLPAFLERISGCGVQRFAIHARKAWLEGLNPKQNRDVPPLNYPLVLRMKAEFPDLEIAINGGITDLEHARAFLDQGMDGVMFGRAAYHHPGHILAPADQVIFGAEKDPDLFGVARAMLPYIEDQLSGGQRLNQITRHMLGLFSGRPGARRWRRYLSEQAHLPGAGPEVVEGALKALQSV